MTQELERILLFLCRNNKRLLGYRQLCEKRRREVSQRKLADQWINIASLEEVMNDLEMEINTHQVVHSTDPEILLKLMSRSNRFILGIDKCIRGISEVLISWLNTYNFQLLPDRIKIDLYLEDKLIYQDNENKRVYTTGIHLANLLDLLVEELKKIYMEGPLPLLSMDNYTLLKTIVALFKDAAVSVSVELLSIETHCCVKGRSVLRSCDDHLANMVAYLSIIHRVNCAIARAYISYLDKEERIKRVENMSP